MNKKGANILGILFAIVGLAYLAFLVVPHLSKSQVSSFGDSAIYRDLFVKLSLSDLIVAAIFCCLGIVMVFWGLLKKRPPQVVNIEKKPWLAKREWQGGPLYSDANTLLLKLSSWKKSARTPLYLDPFPGSIGGNFGGYVEIGGDHYPGAIYKVSISSLQRNVGDPGKKNSYKEKLLWRESGIGDANSYQQRTRVKFRFDIPKGLKETKISGKDEYIIWRFHIECSSKKSKLNRTFDVPVYATGELSKIQYALSKK